MGQTGIVPALIISPIAFNSCCVFMSLHSAPPTPRCVFPADTPLTCSVDFLNIMPSWCYFIL